MPTPFNKPRNAERGARKGEWAARTNTPKSSVFGNYRAGNSCGSLAEPADVAESAQSPPSSNFAACDRTVLQSAIDIAMARSFIYRLLAVAYEDPTPSSWQWLCAPGTQTSFQSACGIVVPAGATSVTFAPAAFDSFLDAYLAVFGHAARGSCPLNEIEYGDIKADPLFQPHRLADLAAFYRAYGLEIASDAGERHDHLCLELEFMCVLAAKETFGLQHQIHAGLLEQCRDAQKNFLREHLGRWTPALTRRLEAAANDATLRALAGFTRAVVESECRRFGVNPGSEELALRPVDETADRMCDSCGINNLPPGALGGAVT